jgi:uncharacterized protein (TIGR02147 family)
MQIRTANQLLREIFLKRKKKNPAYSHRAFARDLGVSQTYISLLLADKRQLGQEAALRLCQSLKLTGERCRAFLESSQDNSSTARVKPPVFSIELDQFRTIAEWFHLPLLDLATTRDFRADAKWISKRLRITTVQAREAFDRLCRLGLLTEQDGKWRKTQINLEIPTRKAHQAVRQFHSQMIDKAKDALQDAGDRAFENREISGITIALNPAKIPLARKRIVEFQEELAALLTDDDCTEVHQLNVQFFPLTLQAQIGENP